MEGQITGDDILDSNGKVAITKPEYWTGDWVCERLVQAFETLRKIGGRIGPKEYGTCWAEYALDYKEVKIRQRAGYGEVELMEEAIAWPGKYIPGNRDIDRLTRDAVGLYCAANAAGDDLEPIIKARKDAAMARAMANAAQRNAAIERQRQQIRDNGNGWFEAQRKRMEPTWAASERMDKLAALQNRRDIRVERDLERLQIIVPKPVDGANGRVITMRALLNFRQAGFALISRRLRADQIPVR